MVMTSMKRANLVSRNVRKVRGAEDLIKKGATLQDVDLTAKKTDYDYVGSIAAVVNEAKARQEKHALPTGGAAELIKGKLPGFDASLLDVKGLAQESRIARLIREASGLIGAKQLVEARAKLDEALAEAPGHHEATYLMALSHYEVGKPASDMESLRWLAKIREEPVEAGLRSRMNVLRDDIRDRLLGHVLFETLLKARLLGYDTVLPKLEELVTLDPETGHYHLVLVNSLMAAKKPGKALDALQAALRWVDPQMKSTLESMRSTIERQQLRALLGPVVELFREREFKQARKVMQAQVGELMHLELAQAFDRWLRELCKGGGFLGLLGLRKNREIRDPEDDEHTEQLYFLVCGPDIEAANALIGRKKPEEAQEPLTRALDVAPSFFYLHYLMGGCIYQEAGKKMTSSSPDLDEQLGLLERAEGYARRGAMDPEIKGAQELYATIQASLKMMRKIADEVRKRAEEVRLLNAAIETYGEIMKSASGGISSVKHFDRLLSDMRSLDSDLGRVERALVSEDAKSAFAQLSEAVAGNLTQLESMEGSMADQRHVSDVLDRFNALMESLKGGLSSASQAGAVLGLFRDLLSDARTAQRSVKGSDAKDTMRQLIAAAEARIGELEEVEAAGREADTVKGHMELFNGVMGAMNSDGFQITSRKQLEDVRGGFETMKRNVDNDKRNMQTAQARQALDQLSDAIGNVLRQLP